MAVETVTDQKRGAMAGVGGMLRGCEVPGVSLALNER